jgi:ribonuclease HI
VDSRGQPVPGQKPSQDPTDQQDIVQQVAAAIASLSPQDRVRLFDLLAAQGVLPGQNRPPAPLSEQLELIPSSAQRAGSPDYILTFDGGSRGNPGWGYGSYLITRVQDGAQRLERLDFGDGYTNNEAEYDALIAALEDLIQRIEAADRQPEEFALEVRGDSALVINQLQGTWRAKEPRMRDRRNRCGQLLGRFGAVTLKAHPREESVRLLGH